MQVNMEGDNFSLESDNPEELVFLDGLVSKKGSFKVSSLKLAPEGDDTDLPTFIKVMFEKQLSEGK